MKINVGMWIHRIGLMLDGSVFFGIFHIKFYHGRDFLNNRIFR